MNNQGTSRGDRAAQWVRDHRSIMGVLWKAHRLIYRLSGGAIGGRMGKNPVLMLTTVGRRSGVERTVALSYFPDGKDMVVIASNGGMESDPAWWLNLKSNPQAKVQLGGKKLAVQAEEVEGEERERIWSMVTQADPQYAGYEKLTARRIPVVVLKPQGATSQS